MKPDYHYPYLFQSRYLHAPIHLSGPHHTRMTANLFISSRHQTSDPTITSPSPSPAQPNMSAMVDNLVPSPRLLLPPFLILMLSLDIFPQTLLCFNVRFNSVKHCSHICLSVNVRQTGMRCSIFALKLTHFPSL